MMRCRKGEKSVRWDEWIYGHKTGEYNGTWSFRDPRMNENCD